MWQFINISFGEYYNNIRFCKAQRQFVSVYQMWSPRGLLGLEDVLEDTFSSPWPWPWPRSLKFLALASKP